MKKRKLIKFWWQEWKTNHFPCFFAQMIEMPVFFFCFYWVVFLPQHFPWILQHLWGKISYSLLLFCGVLSGLILLFSYFLAYRNWKAYQKKHQ